MMPVSGDTSFATIQSHPLRARLTLAFSMTSSVSAANPITRGGRASVPICATCARMSGFSVSDNSGKDPFCFLIFDPDAFSTRQSATAAANIAQETSRFAFTASNISCALSTWITWTPLGGGTSAGPVTKRTSAPKSRNAAAIAVPCAPEDRFAI